jgi:hypothetical protein
VLALAMGTDYNRQSLDEWIREIMVEERDGVHATQIVLMHCRNGSHEDAREVWPAPLGGKKAEELADMFERKARSTAQDLGHTGSGVQHFELWAFFGKTTPGAWHPLIIRSKMPRDGAGSEGPAGLGPDAQRMRQHEAVFQQTYSKQTHLDAVQATLITFLGNSLVNALQENSKLAREAIESFRQAADRSHEYRMEELRAIKSAAFQEKLISYAPALANTAFGKEVFPQNAADTSLIKAIVLGMAEKNPQMLEMFVGALKDDPILGGPVAARIAQILKEKTDEEEAREKALASIPKGPEPEDDAAGGPVIKLVEGGKKK